jgi:hypothetical protein
MAIVHSDNKTERTAQNNQQVSEPGPGELSNALQQTAQSPLTTDEPHEGFNNKRVEGNDFVVQVWLQLEAAETEVRRILQEVMMVMRQAGLRSNAE